MMCRWFQILNIKHKIAKILKKLNVEKNVLVTLKLKCSAQCKNKKNKLQARKIIIPHTK